MDGCHILQNIVIVSVVALVKLIFADVYIMMYLKMADTVIVTA